MTSVLTILLIALFAALSSFVQRVTGFGFGIIMMIMLPYIMPTYGEATALSGILAACMAIVPAVRKRRYVRLKKLLPILLTFVVLSFFSVKVLTVVDGHSLKRWFGIALIIVSIYLFFFNDKVRRCPACSEACSRCRGRPPPSISWRHPTARMNISPLRSGIS